MTVREERKRSKKQIAGRQCSGQGTGIMTLYNMIDNNGIENTRFIELCTQIENIEYIEIDI